MHHQNTDMREAYVAHRTRRLTVGRKPVRSAAGATTMSMCELSGRGISSLDTTQTSQEFRCLRLL